MAVGRLSTGARPEKRFKAGDVDADAARSPAGSPDDVDAPCRTAGRTSHPSAAAACGRVLEDDAGIPAVAGSLAAPSRGIRRRGDDDGVRLDNAFMAFRSHVACQRGVALHSRSARCSADSKGRCRAVVAQVAQTEVDIRRAGFPGLRGRPEKRRVAEPCRCSSGDAMGRCRAVVAQVAQTGVDAEVDDHFVDDDANVVDEDKRTPGAQASDCQRLSMSALSCASSVSKPGCRAAASLPAAALMSLTLLDVVLTTDASYDHKPNEAWPK